MSRPRLLDLFCGAGGSAMGYHRAGFDVVGIDIKPQPNYPFASIQRDWRDLFGSEPAIRASQFDVIHASPPCQGYSSMRHLTRARLAKHGLEPKDYPRLIEPVRQALVATGLPYVIENVMTAPLRHDLKLCGSMFGLRVRRHRLFELSTGPLLAPRCNHPEQGEWVGVYGRRGDGRRLWSRRETRIFNEHGESTMRTELRAAKNLEDAKDAMGIDWMDWDEIREAIPPAYTEFIGRQLLRTLHPQDARATADPRA